MNETVVYLKMCFLIMRTSINVLKLEKIIGRVHNKAVGVSARFKKGGCLLRSTHMFSTYVVMLLT